MTTKQEILDYLDNVLHPIVSPDNWNVYAELYDMIEELPSTYPKKGKLIKHGAEEGYLNPVYTCSECGEYLGRCISIKFCSNCGADMRKSE